MGVEKQYSDKHVFKMPDPPHAIYLMFFSILIAFVFLCLDPIHQKHFEKKWDGVYQVLICDKETNEVVKNYNDVDIKVLTKDNLVFEAQLKLNNKTYTAFVFDDLPPNCFYKVIKSER